MRTWQKRVVLMVVAIASIWFIGSVALPAIIGDSEAEYQKNTPAEVKAQHVAMTEKLKTVTPGDLLFMTAEFDAKEKIYLVEKMLPIDHHVGRIQVDRVLYFPEQLGRIVTRLVRKTDSDWPEVAKKFFEQ